MITSGVRKPAQREKVRVCACGEVLSVQNQDSNLNQSGRTLCGLFFVDVLLYIVEFPAVTVHSLTNDVINETCPNLC